MFIASEVFANIDKQYYLYGAIALVAIVLTLFAVLVTVLRKHKIEFVNEVVPSNEELTPIKARGGKAIELPVLSAKGYDFAGWYYDAGCTELCDLEKMPKKDVVLYAGWRRKKEKKAHDPNPISMNLSEGISHNLAFRISLDW